MHKESLQLKNIKPYLSGYISKAKVLLRKNPVPDEDAVHDIRVLMKKSRAVLKLFRSGQENEMYSKDLQEMRRVGQIMSEWRDTSVHRKTLKELRKEFPGILTELEGIEKIAILIKKPEIIKEPDEEMKNGIEEIDDLLNRSGYRIRFHQMDKIDPLILISQLELSYNTVRNVYLESRNCSKPEKIHELRKRSKDFLYQLWFFRPLNPSRVKSLEKRVEKMTISLGRYNDLYQLLTIMGYKYPNESNLPALDELVIKIREKQDNYLSKVWPDAYKCFCPGEELVSLIGIKQKLPLHLV